MSQCGVGDDFQALHPGMPSSLTYDPQVCHRREERGRECGRSLRDQAYTNLKSVHIPLARTSHIAPPRYLELRNQAFGVPKGKNEMFLGKTQQCSVNLHCCHGVSICEKARVMYMKCYMQKGWCHVNHSLICSFFKTAKIDWGQDSEVPKFLSVKEFIVYSMDYGVELKAFEEGGYLNKFVH